MGSSLLWQLSLGLASARPVWTPRSCLWRLCCHPTRRKTLRPRADWSPGSLGACARCSAARKSVAEETRIGFEKKKNRLRTDQGSSGQPNGAHASKREQNGTGPCVYRDLGGPFPYPMLLLLASDDKTLLSIFTCIVACFVYTGFFSPQYCT